MTSTTPLQAVIVGAGPAGIRAAQTLAAHGLRPVLIDEAARGGGQVYRRPPAHFQRPPRALYGSQAARATALHRTLDGLQAQIDYQSDSLVWNAEGGQLDLLHGPTQTTRTLRYGPLIVASGAIDRVLPVPGWTLPGVYTLGAAQVALKFQGCAIGRNVVLMGTGPLLYLVAYQYARCAGTRVAAVLDTARRADQLAAVPALLAEPAILARGLHCVAWLRAHGVPIHRGIRPVRVQGDARVSAVVWSDGAQQHRLACDAIGLGHGLRSETQLADLLDCRFVWSPAEHAHLPAHDAAGRSSVPGVYLAGDGAGIMGADAAECAGERAALALLADHGRAVDGARARQLERRLGQLRRVGQALARAFPLPADWAAQAPDALLLCRCENITAGQLRACARETGADEMNRLKALTRIGMGRCQGRICALAGAEILAQATGRPVEQVGRLRGQAPIKPIPLHLQTQQVADGTDAAAPPRDE
ncbi:NAD(P)/FAD-dependent oxidoreductase [Verminephrobacter eiseniae]|uniref:NAD(P)/FAD-dependent oxidoreductase n=1 Tax=Verminephrobacter eiseniae TaxID=364317 RepID=UPI00223804AF|nr:FAD/NAD(P)-binding oxidoreductase [Verminephrobacter eiseniae]MCW5233612.1 FAD/NAD(P)-binding oxidoreductase [Verminephrobacter eiseniae]MCW5294833.1 FAD/NAD(P)-binding oxidoreductase [Verminephrobacter eiseniae]MCW8187809.1 FAD/NAD(P)-binding oxidoreductase [Verminephrobacter eiseniae]MCW8222084.1 FAD/NAD(P)-binding oxidoreductase [Verminephrobacter eiseniae]MCW8233782.1 FAD/NAD(P)-binding oxidoreductase [Verminephrobacter eiseniae]